MSWCALVYKSRCLNVNHDNCHIAMRERLFLACVWISLGQVIRFTNGGAGYKTVPAGKSVGSIGKGGGNFGRLKTHKIIALAKKVSRIKQENEEQVVEENYRRRSAVDYSENENTNKRKTGQVLGRETSSLQRDKTRVQEAGVEEDEDENEVDERHYDTHEVSRIYPVKVKKSESSRARPDLSTPKKPVPEIRGWNRGDSMQRSGYVPDYPPMRWQKSADKEFFSRKSFKDIGCKEYMIECLRAQGFSRPSNIQV